MTRETHLQLLKASWACVVLFGLRKVGDVRVCGGVDRRWFAGGEARVPTLAEKSGMRHFSAGHHVLPMAQPYAGPADRDAARHLR
jgi:hypothetical protein